MDIIRFVDTVAPIIAIVVRYPFENHYRRAPVEVSEPPPPAPPSEPPQATLGAPSETPKPTLEPPAYSGTSQISSAGKACLPCASDHWAGVAGLIAESIRFARTGGIEHPEVAIRLSHAEQEIAALEREDGSPDKLVNLSPRERDIMNDILVKCREFRHSLWDATTVGQLETQAATAQQIHTDLRGKLLKMQIEILGKGKE